MFLSPLICSYDKRKRVLCGPLRGDGDPNRKVSIADLLVTCMGRTERKPSLLGLKD